MNETLWTISFQSLFVLDENVSVAAAASATVSSLSLIRASRDPIGTSEHLVRSYTSRFGNSQSGQVISQS